MFGSLIQPDPELTVRLKQHIAAARRRRRHTPGRRTRLGGTGRDAGRVPSPALPVVVANPPYMGASNMVSELRVLAKENYPGFQAGPLCHVHRRVASARTIGWHAMITMQSWMFLSSPTRSFGSRTLSGPASRHWSTLATRAFDIILARFVATTAFVLQAMAVDDAAGVYVRDCGWRRRSYEASGTPRGHTTRTVVGGTRVAADSSMRCPVRRSHTGSPMPCGGRSCYGPALAETSPQSEGNGHHR